MKRRANGSGTVNYMGYIAHQIGAAKRMEHVLVAERVLGKPLPIGAVVHHVNDDRADNRPANLVICPNQAYHRLIHANEDAINACGHANFRRCRYCRLWSDPSTMTRTGNNRKGHQHYHKICKARAERERTAR